MNIKKFTLIGLLTIFCLTGLFLTAARAEWSDYGDNCGDAEVTGPNSIIIYGYIDPWSSPSDEDWFKITVDDPGTLTIYTTDTNWDTIGDTMGTLYDGCGGGSSLIAENDDAATANENFRISESVGEGTYYLRVASGGNNYGTYHLHVEFTARTTDWTITASAGTGGSISPSGAVGAADGGVQTFTITPDACYEVADVLVQGSSVGAQTSYTFTNITGDQTIAASFDPTSDSTITVTADSGGSVSPGPGPVPATCGADKAFTIAAGAGYLILDVKANGVSVFDPAGPGGDLWFNYTFPSVTADQTLDATFKLAGSQRCLHRHFRCAPGYPGTRRTGQHHVRTGRLRQHGLGIYNRRKRRPV